MRHCRYIKLTHMKGTGRFHNYTDCTLSDFWHRSKQYVIQYWISNHIQTLPTDTQERQLLLCVNVNIVQSWKRRKTHDPGIHTNPIHKMKMEDMCCTILHMVLIYVHHFTMPVLSDYRNSCSSRYLSMPQ